MPRSIAFDMSRLYVGALGSTPRGIDRVDLGVAGRLFGTDGPHCGIVPSLTGMGVVPSPAARRIVRGVEAHWREAPRLAADGRLGALQSWLAGDGPPPAEDGPVPRRHGLPWHLAGLAWPARWAGLRPARWRVPEGAVYLNTGQVLVGFPWCFRWLDRRSDVKPVFLLHDLIPLRFPEYAGPLLMRHHARALANVARRASAMIATSEAAAAEVRAGLAALGRRDMPIHVAPLPVSAALLGPAAAPSPRPYFVTVGIIDQRKNHRLLLHVWRDMVRSLGPAAPKLAILGARGLRTRELHDFVARSPGLAGAVTIVSGLPSAALREILQGARALLMPSFAEGFGLPLIEARALGLPVIASDIPAHREVGGATTILLDPLDGPEWQGAILSLAEGAPRQAADPPMRPQTEDGYFASILPFLEAL